MLETSYDFTIRINAIEAKRQEYKRKLLTGKLPEEEIGYIEDVLEALFKIKQGYETLKSYGVTMEVVNG